MRKFLVKINAYNHYASFEVEAEDNAESIEKSILDKIGEKSINWESAGMFKDTIIEIKAEERKIADRENAIVNSAPQVSVAT